MNISGTDVDELLEIATALARDSGRLVLEYWTSAGPAPEVAESIRSKSTRTDLVTAADHASEALIIKTLADKRPDDAVLAEETGARPGTSGLTWVVDPLDGTINFVYGFPVFGVSVACKSDDTTLVGVVHDPLRDETFSAIAGRGAWRDAEELRLGPGPAMGEALVGTGFGYGARRREDQARIVRHVLPEVRDIRRAGAAAIDLCWVAAGRLDAHYEAGLAPWDLAAGSLVVTEAGGTVENVLGLIAKEPDLPTLIAAAPGLGIPLRALLEQAAHVET